LCDGIAKLRFSHIYHQTGHRNIHFNMKQGNVVNKIRILSYLSQVS